MSVAEKRVLALAVRHGRVAFVYLQNGQPTEWALSVKAARSAQNARGFLGKWLATLEPEVIVLENPLTPKRKGKRAKSLLSALQQVAEQSPAMVIPACRAQHYPNAYDEAKAFATAYPQLAGKLPTRRKPWESEPRNLIYVEALALAQNVGFLPLDFPEPE